MAAALAGLAAGAAAPAASQAAGGTPAMAPYVEKVPGTLVSFAMMPVPGGRVQVETADGARTMDVAPLWMAQTEVTWDLFDVFVYRLDRTAESDTTGADAVSRPTRPYVLPGEQFGHAGRPALAMTFHAAREFARWLSRKTGRTYRLPTEAEWEHACRLGGTEPDGPHGLAARAWFGGHAADRTHPVGSLAPNALGLHDLLGNVAEWVVAADGDSVVKGGAFSDDAGRVLCGARRGQTPAWNATDPQLPKSRWWLPDAPFVGLRLVRQP